LFITIILANCYPYCVKRLAAYDFQVLVEKHTPQVLNDRVPMGGMILILI